MNTTILLIILEASHLLDIFFPAFDRDTTIIVIHSLVIALIAGLGPQAGDLGHQLAEHTLLVGRDAGVEGPLDAGGAEARAPGGAGCPTHVAADLVSVNEQDAAAATVPVATEHSEADIGAHFLVCAA